MTLFQLLLDRAVELEGFGGFTPNNETPGEAFDLLREKTLEELRFQFFVFGPGYGLASHYEPLIELRPRLVEAFKEGTQ